MADSLRVRLLGWYAAIVTLVVAIVGVAVCWMTWQSRMAAIDAELRASAESVSSAVRPGVGGRFDVELPSEATTYFQGNRARPYYAVWSADGSLVDRSDPDIAPVKAPDAAVRTRGYRREVVVRSRGLTILTGRDIGDVWRELWSLAITMTIVAFVGGTAALGGAWLLAGRALAPVQRINETARRMAEGDLTARIEVDRAETELDQVAFALNLAFDRQRESVERQRRFAADASHELRTPVATIMAELDWALFRGRDAAEYRDSLETCRRAGARMQSLVEGLLTLARADSGELALRRRDVRLDRIVEEAIDMLRPLAQQREVSFQISILPALVTGDPDRLHDLATNLLFNAVAYTQPDGLVRVEVRADEETVTLVVRDTGIGIEAEDLPRIFDRFYRSDQARAREPAGAGLGLALAKWIAEAHRGSIVCSSEPGRCSEFVVRLPAASHAAATDGAGRLSVRLAAPPAAPTASTTSVAAGLQIDPSPSTASSE
jgi:two-component system, OmpR family, sensor kinase